MRLEYNIAVVGQRSLDRALGGLERRFAIHNARVSRDFGVPTAARRGGPYRARAVRDDSAKTIAGIAALGKAARQIEHRQVMAQIRSEEREKIASAKRVLAAEKAAAREAARASREAQRSRMAFARGTVGAMRGAGRSLAAVGGAGVGLLGVAGSIAVGAALGTETSERARASKLANQAGRPELKNTLLSEARGVRGYTGMEGLEALGKFTDVTGDLDAARKLLPRLGELALATGTQFDELAAAAGNAFIPLSDQIKDPQKRLDALMTTMRAVAGMGAIGAVEIKDLATEMAGLAAISNQFKGRPEEIMQSVVAMTQAARQRGGAKGPEEAALAAIRFSTDVTSKGKKLEAAGVKVFADKGRTQLLNPEDIMVNIMKSTKGDLTKLGDIFGERGIRAVQGFSPLYTRAGGGAAGEAAVRAEFARFRNANVTEQQVKARAASRLEDPDIIFREAMKNFSGAVAKDLLPALTKLVPEIAKLTPYIARAASGFADLLGWLSKNPWKGIGAVIGLVLTKEIVSAGIPKLIQNAFVGSGAAGVGGRGVGLGGKTTGGGILDALSGGFAVGTISAGLITAAGISVFEKSEAGFKRTGADVLAAKTQTPEQLAKNIKGQADELQKKEQLFGAAKTLGDIMSLGGVGKYLGVGGMVGSIGSLFHEEVGAPQMSTELKTRQGMLKQTVETAQKRGLVKPEDTAAVDSLAKAASAAATALLKLGSDMPNRGNSPSPVK